MMEGERRAEHFRQGTMRNGNEGYWRHTASYLSPDGKDAAYVQTKRVPDGHHAHYGWEPAKAGQPGQQGTMIHSDPENHVVDMAFSTRGARDVVPTLMGMTSVHSLRNRGAIPGASDDLSEHSGKMVSNLIKRRVIQNPRVGGFDTRIVPSNNHDFDTAHDEALDVANHMKNRPERYDAPSDHDVRLGQQFIRHMVTMRGPEEGASHDQAAEHWRNSNADAFDRLAKQNSKGAPRKQWEQSSPLSSEQQHLF